MEDKEKKEIQEAEIDEIKSSDNEDDKVIDEIGGDKKNYRTEIILIFIIGLLLGVMIKAEALKSLSIGFSDYKVKGGKQGYDVMAIEKKMKEEAEMKRAQAEAATKEAQQNNAKGQDIQAENPNSN